jgi:hypothetical protein
MKRLFLPAAALVLLPAVVSAQPTAPVQVTVMSEAQLKRDGITDFGPVGTHGQTYTIDPKRPVGAQQTARFTASGISGATFILEWNPEFDLCHQNGCGLKLVFTPKLSSTELGAGFQGQSTDITSGAELVLNHIGEHYIFLGGSVRTDALQPPGVYSGTFTLRATFK